MSEKSEKSEKLSIAVTDAGDGVNIRFSSVSRSISFALDSRQARELAVSLADALAQHVIEDWKQR